MLNFIMWRRRDTSVRGTASFDVHCVKIRDDE